MAADGLRVPPSVDLAAIVIGALTGGLLAAREGFAVSGVLLLAVSGGLGGGLIRDVLLAQRADIVQPGPYNAVAALIGAVALTVLAGPAGLEPLPVAACRHHAAGDPAGAVGVARLGGAGRPRPAGAHAHPARPAPRPQAVTAS